MLAVKIVLDQNIISDNLTHLVYGALHHTLEETDDMRSADSHYKMRKKKLQGF